MAKKVQEAVPFPARELTSIIVDYQSGGKLHIEFDASNINAGDSSQLIRDIQRLIEDSTSYVTNYNEVSIIADILNEDCGCC